jgi:hypothetical protein
MVAGRNDDVATLVAADGGRQGKLVHWPHSRATRSRAEEWCPDSGGIPLVALVGLPVLFSRWIRSHAVDAPIEDLVRRRLVVGPVQDRPPAWRAGTVVVTEYQTFWEQHSTDTHTGDTQ